jgi:hypothetical protein
MKDFFEEEGYQANEDGFERSNNPYYEGSDGHEGWRLGWEKKQNEEG